MEGSFRADADCGLYFGSLEPPFSLFRWGLKYEPLVAESCLRPVSGRPQSILGVFLGFLLLQGSRG